MKEWNGMNGGKQDLERACLQQNARTELLGYRQRKDKLDMDLQKTSQNYEVTTCHSWKRYDWEL